MAGLFGSKESEASKKTGGLFNQLRPQLNAEDFENKFGMSPPPIDLSKSPRVQEAKRYAEENPEPEIPSFGRLLGNVAKEYVREPYEFASRISAAAQTTIAPKGPMFKKGGGYDLDTPTPYERAVDQQEQVGLGGNADKVADFIGGAAGLFIPVGGSGVGRFYNNPLTQRVVDSVGSKVGNGLFGKVAQEATREALVGAPLAAQQSLVTGNGDLTQVAKETALGGLFGAATGSAAPLIGAGFRKFAGTKIGDALTGLFGRSQSVSPETEQATKSLLERYRSDQTQSLTGTLKPAGQDQYINKVMGDIRDTVNQRMTPPLENQKELAKWLQPHLGNDSLNEIRKLSYDDMVELAGEVRNGLSTHDIAMQVSRERGFNLDDILKGKLPSVPERVKLDAQKRTYGIYPETLPKVQTPKFETPNVPDPVKQNWFERLFGTNTGVGISPFGSNKGTRMVSTEQQIVTNPLKSNVKGVLNTTKQGVRGGYQNTVDYLSPLKTINRETYNSAMDASRANNLANTIIRDKFVDLEGNVIGGSLDDIMKQASGLGKKLDDYLVLRHAVTRMGRGEKVYDNALNMTPEKARAAVETLEKRYPQLAQVGKDWDALNTNLPYTMGVKEGLLSENAFNIMKTENPNYASMRRQFTLGEKLAQPKWSGGQSFSGQNAPIKSVSPTGSTRKIVSPVRSAIEQTYAWTNAALRNRTMQEIVKSIQLDPDGMKGIAEIVKKPSTSYRSLDDALREGGSEEFLEQLDNDFKSLFKPAKAGEENIVRAMVNGSPVYVKVNNPEAAKALLGLGSEQSGLILNAMQKLSNATKRGATGMLAPMFAVKNLTADTVQAAIQSPNAFKHIAVDLPSAVISSIGDIFKIPGMKNLAEDFRRSGGEYSALLRGDRAMNRNLYELRREAPLSPKGIVKGAYTGIKAPFKALEKVADVTENVNRMAAFRRAMVGKERTPENVRNAINAARESTTNFSRRGAMSRETEAFVPYSNAAVQGIYRITRAFAKNPVKTLAGVGTLVVAPKLYEYSKFNDDPDYQKLPARERYRNLIISKNADGTFNKQPMPPEYEAFGALITDVLNHVVNNDPQAYKGTLDALANAFTPPLVSGALQGATQGGGLEQSIKGTFNSTVLSPAVAIAGNQSFTGAPIVPKRLESNSPKYQYDERTSSVAKKIGEKLGFAPLKVDYLLRAYGGDPARLLLPLTSPVGGGTVRNTLLKNFIVDPTFTNTLSNDYFDAKDAYAKADKDNKEFNAPLPSWYKEDMSKALSSQANSSVSKQLSALNEEKRTVQGDKSLSSKVKAEKLRDIQANINNIYVDVNSQLQQSGYKFPNR